MADKVEDKVREIWKEKFKDLTKWTDEEVQQYICQTLATWLFDYGKDLIRIDKDLITEFRRRFPDPKKPVHGTKDLSLLSDEELKNSKNVIESQITNQLLNVDEVDKDYHQRLLEHHKIFIEEYEKRFGDKFLEHFSKIDISDWLPSQGGIRCTNL